LSGLLVDFAKIGVSLLPSLPSKSSTPLLHPTPFSSHTSATISPLGITHGHGGADYGGRQNGMTRLAYAGQRRGGAHRRGRGQNPTHKQFLVEHRWSGLNHKLEFWMHDKFYLLMSFSLRVILVFIILAEIATIFLLAAL